MYLLHIHHLMHDCQHMNRDHAADSFEIVIHNVCTVSTHCFTNQFIIHLMEALSRPVVCVGGGVQVWDSCSRLGA